MRVESRQLQPWDATGVILWQGVLHLHQANAQPFVVTSPDSPLNLSGMPDLVASHIGLSAGHRVFANMLKAGLPSEPRN